MTGLDFIVVIMYNILIFYNLIHLDPKSYMYLCVMRGIKNCIFCVVIGGINLIEKNFAEWLEEYTEISAYSVRRYSGAIPLITSELESYGLESVNLLAINDCSFIDEILLNNSFKLKDQKGNRMYSAALNHFKKYINYKNELEYERALVNEKLIFKSHLNHSINNDERADTQDNIENPQLNKPRYTVVNNRKIWMRNPEIAVQALRKADYTCEIDKSHNHFISKYTQKNYVEAHHLIPMKYQSEFTYSLDIESNIVSLCLVCHKKLHYAAFEEKKSILEKLYLNRKQLLHRSGIALKLTDFYRMYQ